MIGKPFSVKLQVSSAAARKQTSVVDIFALKKACSPVHKLHPARAHS